MIFTPAKNIGQGFNKEQFQKAIVLGRVNSITVFSKYKLIIFPDRVPLDKELAKKLKAFTQNGGKVLATGLSGINETREFMLDFDGDYAHFTVEKFECH